jgi:hypothetical protein
MKKEIALLLITVIALTVKAQQNNYTDRNKKRYEHFKERNISRSFSASGNILSIDNRFGDVNIIASSGNEIKIDIHLGANF